MAGIDMLPPDAGIPLIRRELTAGARRGEIVIGQSLGVLLKEWDPTGGLELEEKDRHTGVLAGPMLGRIAGAGLFRPLIIETVLDPKVQPFLRDHQIDGTPVLPGVMGIEAFAEAALAILPGWQIAQIEDVNFMAPFKFYRHEPRAVTVEALVQPCGSDLTARCRLIGYRQLPTQSEPQATTHFTARVRMTRAPSALAGPSIQLAPKGAVIEAKDIYKLYFHGPAYQVIECAWRNEKQIIGQMSSKLPNNHEPSALPLAMAPRLIELCFQTAGIWELGVQKHMGLPMHINRVSVVAGPHERQPGTLYAVITPNVEKGTLDGEVVDSSGTRYVELSGYSTVTVPNAVNVEDLRVLQEAMCPELVAA
jgi:hypothetical protein